MRARCTGRQKDRAGRQEESRTEEQPTCSIACIHVWSPDLQGTDSMWVLWWEADRLGDWVSESESCLECPEYFRE